MEKYIISPIERERNFFIMKNVEGDAQSSISEAYDRIVMDTDGMNGYIRNSCKEEQIKLYKYVCRRAAELKDDAHREEMIPFYWLASVELEQTEAVKLYLSGLITDEDLEAYEAKRQARREQAEAEKEAQIQEIMEKLAERKKAKTPLGKLKRMFSQKNSKTK